MNIQEAIINELIKLEEMAYKVGNINSKLMVYVNSDDSGSIPHFHIVDETTRGKEFNTCVRIEKAQYFTHSNKQDRLNTTQRKQLQKFLSQPFKRSKFNGTNWEFIVMSWNDNNSNSNVDEKLKQPNYTNIEEYK